MDCSITHAGDAFTHAFSFHDEFLEVMVSESKHEMSCFYIPTPALKIQSMTDKDLIGYDYIYHFSPNPVNRLEKTPTGDYAF